MAFDDDAFRQFLRSIRERPEWHEELRRLVLSEELLTVPERLARIEAALERLAARVDQLAEHLAALTGRVGQLVEAVTLLAGRLQPGQRAGDPQRARGRSLRAGGRAGPGPSAPREGLPLSRAAAPVAMNGEVDVASRVQEPAGQIFSVLLEAKGRLHRGDVSAWHRRLRDRAVPPGWGWRGSILRFWPTPSGCASIETPRPTARNSIASSHTTRRRMATGADASTGRRRCAPRVGSRVGQSDPPPK